MPTIDKASLETIYFTKPFEFIGNSNGVKVKKTNEQLGDGDIYTQKGKFRHFSIQAKLQQTTTTNVRLTLTFRVWENDFGKSKDSDSLYFIGTQDYSLSQYCIVNKQTKEGNSTITTNKDCNLVSVNEAYYQYSLKLASGETGYFNPRSNKHSLQNSPSQLQSWLPESNLLVKIDGGGSELKKEGNLAIKGYVKFGVKVNTHQRIFTPDEIVSSAVQTKPTYGSWSVLGVQKLEKVYPVLGRGYHIDGGYANIDNLAESPFDLVKLDNYRRIEKNSNAKYDGASFIASGSKEYTQKMEKSLEVKVSGGAFGVSFSSETKKTFSEERYSKEGYKLYTIKDGFYYNFYRIQGFSNPVELTGFLSEGFCRDLNSLNATQFINKYGTHVVMGMYLGGRLFYNMSYRQSLSKISKAETFSSVNSIGYSKPDGMVKPAETPSGDDTYSKILKKLEDASIKDIINSKEIVELLKHLKENGGTGSSSTNNSKPSSSGVSTSVSYTENTSASTKEEIESTEIKCSGVGGDIKWFKEIESDPSKFQKWLDSLNSNNSDWCDFVPKTLIPIYEFVPAGYKLKANDVKKAWEQYLKEHSLSLIPTGKKTISTGLKTFMAAGKCVNWSKEIAGKDFDGDIYTSSGKATGWRLFFQLINLDGGRAGVLVRLRVYEDGLQGERSIIELRDVCELSLGNYKSMAIDSTKPLTCEFEGEITGKNNDWIDVTNNPTAQNCSFLDTNGSTIKIKLDGPGDDYGNIGVKCSFKVPVLYYDYE